MGAGSLCEKESVIVCMYMCMCQRRCRVQARRSGLSLHVYECVLRLCVYV